MTVKPKSSGQEMSREKRKKELRLMCQSKRSFASTLARSKYYQNYHHCA
jgi:hypothetical protein